MSLLFAPCIFLGAALLFLIEPMAVKQVLPILGGSPSAWNTAMVFFQGTLLAGYAAAHAIGRARMGRNQILGLILLISGVPFLPVALVSHPGDANAHAHPVPWLLGTLAVGLGIPFLALAAAGPLLQKWYSATRSPRSADPYFLYSASNAGSLAGLLAFPLVIEPFLTMRQQTIAWAVGYATFVAGAALCAALALRSTGVRSESFRAAPAGEPSAPVRLTTRFAWMVLAAIPSSLMLGATQHISTDIAAAPLLWVVPLAIYLSTFVVAFSRLGPRAVHGSSTVLAISTVAVALTILAEVKTPMAFLFALHLTLLGSACMMCHGRLAAIRPAPAHLTEFYLIVGLGGVLGGALTSLAAPILFTRVLEYPLAIAAVCFLRPSRRRATWHRPDPVPGARNIIRIPITEILGSMIVLVVTWLCLPAITPGPGRTIAALVMPVLGISASSLIRFRFGFAAAAVTLLLLAQLAPALRERDLFRVRTFFGVHRVTLDSSHSFHALYHGATLHGMQSVDPGLASMALTYYTESSPLNRLLRSLNDQGSLHRIAVVGLGTGALAAFGKPGQQIDFYEIDPAVARIASDPSLFSYLSHPAAEIHIILGDGRLELLSSSSTYDLIILDAFSSDAVPVHLLTTEAVRAYAARLAPGGLLVFNISSRYFDLASVIAAVARAEGLTSAFASDEAVSPQDHALGKRASRWAVVARSQSDLGPVLRDPIWNPPRPSAALPWTDDYSNIISVLRWRVQPATPPDPLSSQHGRP